MTVTRVYAVDVPSPKERRVLRSAAPTGPGWVYGVVARRTYRRRIGLACSDLALQADGHVLVLRRGWRWVGRQRPPLVEVLEQGWLPRPYGLSSSDTTRGPDN